MLSISYGTVARSFFGIEVTILYLRIVGLVQFPSSFKISEFYCDDGVIIVHSEGLFLRWLRFRKPFSIFQLHALVKRKTYASKWLRYTSVRPDSVSHCMYNNKPLLQRSIVLNHQSMHPHLIYKSFWNLLTFIMFKRRNHDSDGIYLFKYIFGYRCLISIDFYDFISPFSPLFLFRLRKYIKHSRQYFTTFPVPRCASLFHVCGKTPMNDCAWIF